jgi:hypothetical protein
MTIMYLGNEEVVLIQIPRGFHALAAQNHIDLKEVALMACTERVRAAQISDHMSKSIQMKFGQKLLLNAD